MTLKQVIRAIEAVASRQPSIRMVVENDVFRLNSHADARYGVFAWTQGNHTTSVDSSIINYAFTFFYVDRLKEDESNMVEIQSVGVETLDNIVRSLEAADIIAEGSLTFTTFNQRFSDNCAGVYCGVTLSVPVASVCGEEFGEIGDIVIY